MIPPPIDAPGESVVINGGAPVVVTGPPGERFGAAVAVACPYFAVGTPLANDSGIAQMGGAHIYRITDGTPTLAAQPVGETYRAGGPRCLRLPGGCGVACPPCMLGRQPLTLLTRQRSFGGPPMRWFLGIPFIMLACLPQNGGGGTCDQPGESIECRCQDGTTGRTLCTDDLRPGFCVCPDGGTSASDAGHRTDATATSDGGHSADAATASDAGVACGNGRVDPPETCDGAQFGEHTCQSHGFGGGQLRCVGCARIDTAGCVPAGCTPDCGARTCGPDPVCQSTCGICQDGQCNDAGQCEAPPQAAPRILAFASDVNEITRGGALTFSAIVTDADGIQDVIGGTLESQEGDVFGAFAASGDEGAYERRLTWNQINAVRSIEFDESEQRSFVARFYDVAGNETTATIQINLHCRGQGACDGTCVDLQEASDNCGQCNRRCDGDSWCDFGQCITWVQGPMSGRSCDDICDTAEGPPVRCAPMCNFSDGHGDGRAGAFGYACEGQCGQNFRDQPTSECGHVPAAQMEAEDGIYNQVHTVCCCVTE